MISELLKGHRQSLLGLSLGQKIADSKTLLARVNASLEVHFQGHRVDVQGAKIELHDGLGENNQGAYFLSASIKSKTMEGPDVGALHVSVDGSGILLDVTVATQSNPVPHLQWVGQLIHREAQSIGLVMGAPNAAMDQIRSWEKESFSHGTPNALWAQTWIYKDEPSNGESKICNTPEAYAQLVRALVGSTAIKVPVMTVTLGTLSDQAEKLCLFGMARLQMI